MHEKQSKYSVAIRTLGTAGAKYQNLLENLREQTFPPEKICVFIADGYKRPDESIGKEEIIYVKKGMVAQRALQYSEINTEWILFLDDDISLENDSVEKMFNAIFENKADVCAPDLFPHHKLPLRIKLAMALMLTAIPRFLNKEKGYTVNCLGSDSYNINPKLSVAYSTTNAGGAFLCRKEDFIRIHFENDAWIDEASYSSYDDKVMFYKMHLEGLKILTLYDSGVAHLDAETSKSDFKSLEKKELKMARSYERNKNIFDYLYIRPYLTSSQRMLRWVVRPYMNMLLYLYNFCKGRMGFKLIKAIREGKMDAKAYIRSVSSKI